MKNTSHDIYRKIVIAAGLLGFGGTVLFAEAEHLRHLVYLWSVTDPAKETSESPLREQKSSGSITALGPEHMAKPVAACGAAVEDRGPIITIIVVPVTAPLEGQQPQ